MMKPQTKNMLLEMIEALETEITDEQFNMGVFFGINEKALTELIPDTAKNKSEVIEECSRVTHNDHRHSDALALDFDHSLMIRQRDDGSFELKHCGTAACLAGHVVIRFGDKSDLDRAFHEDTVDRVALKLLDVLDENGKVGAVGYDIDRLFFTTSLDRAGVVANLRDIIEKHAA